MKRVAYKRDISVLKWEGEGKKRHEKASAAFRRICLVSLLTSTLLTIRMSVLTTTVEHPIKYHQKFFQFVLEGVFKDVTVSIGSLTP